MLSGFLLSSANKKGLYSSAKWASTVLLNGMEEEFPDFEKYLEKGLDRNPSLGYSIKSNLQKDIAQHLDQMLDYYETSTDEKFYFYIDLVDEKMIFRDVDVEICYHLGIRMSQINGKELSEEIMPEAYEKKKQAIVRAFKGEIVECISRTPKGIVYSVRLVPVKEKGNIHTIKGTVFFSNDLNSYSIVDQYGHKMTITNQFKEFEMNYGQLIPVEVNHS